MKEEKKAQKPENEKDVQSDQGNDAQENVNEKAKPEEEEKAKKTSSTTGKKKKRISKKSKDEARITELEQELGETKEKFLRSMSEFDNYRKRTLREKEELQKTASAGLMSSILPVVDDFERAIKSFNETDNKDALKEGIDLIFNKLNGILKQKGLEAIESIGQDFDTDMHEAITKIPATDPEMKGKVIDEVEKGYTLKGKVLRYSKVVIGD